MKTCKILISNLELMASIGIYDVEKANKQRVIISVEAETTFPDEAVVTDDIEKTVSYEAIINQIKELLSGKHIELVETLVQKVANICLAYDNVLSVKVKIEKPDIIAEAKSVGVEFFIKKDNV